MLGAACLSGTLRVVIDRGHQPVCQCRGQARTAPAAQESALSACPAAKSITASPSPTMWPWMRWCGGSERGGVSTPDAGIYMPAFVPDKDQTVLIDNVCHWYPNRSQQKQAFLAAGVAGSGKTTSVKHALDKLGLTKVMGAAPSGMAAQVLQRATGLPCSTIHQLIYIPYKAPADKIRGLKQQITALEKQGSS